MLKDERVTYLLNATLIKHVSSVHETLSAEYFCYQMNPFMLQA